MGKTQLVVNRLAADKHEGNGTGDTTLESGVGVKGAWVEALPSITIFANYLILIVHDAEAATDYSIDIGIGPPGSEEVLIPNIKYHVNITANNIITVPYPFKVEIPAGSRISARCQNVAAVDVDVNITISGT